MCSHFHYIYLANVIKSSIFARPMNTIDPYVRNAFPPFWFLCAFLYMSYSRVCLFPLLQTSSYYYYVTLVNDYSDKIIYTFLFKRDSLSEHSFFHNCITAIVC